MGRSLAGGMGRGVGVGRIVAVGVGLGVSVGVGVIEGVGVIVGVGVAVASGGAGASIFTLATEPVLKKLIAALAIVGALSASKRKLYSVPKRMALAF